MIKVKIIKKSFFWKSSMFIKETIIFEKRIKENFTKKISISSIKIKPPRVRDPNI